MRKTLIALIVVLPMVFVLVIFSSVNIISLGVNVAVDGITIRAEGTDEEGTLLIDMADEAEHVVSAEVSPSNATEKGYTLSSSDPALAEISQNGVILPKREGTVSITATSNDKSFTDSISVVIVSSKAYDFDFSLYGTEEDDLLTATEEGYEATVQPGTYTYGMNIHPMEYTQYTLRNEGTTEAEIERGAKTIFLPFTGDVELSASVPDGVRGEIRKEILLHVAKSKPDGVLINGEEDGFGGLKLAAGATSARIYVECAGKPTFSSDHARLASTTGSNGKYIMDLAIEEGVEDDFRATINAGGKRFDFLISFTEFSFSVFSDRTIQTAENGGQKVTLLTGNAASFYAVGSAGAKDVRYEWSFNGPQEYFKEEEGVVTITAAQGGNFVLKVTARYGDRAPVTQEIALEIIQKISVVQITNSVKADLAASYTVAGLMYTADLKTAENTYPLRVYTHSTAGTAPAGEDIVYSVSNPAIAEVVLQSGQPVLLPKGTGEVTVTAAWRGNEAFHANVAATLTVNVVKDAVAVKNAPELNRAMEEKRAAVLTADIRLGTDANGKDLTLEQRGEVLKSHRMKSTYNTAWYETTSDSVTEDSSKISYVLEFTANVYGNGRSIDADNFTHVLDASGMPLLSLYAGPLYFVKYRQMASVAGQDNCAFLIRTDGVKLYGVNLLGCSDKSLLNPEGAYDLTSLNLTGTTLEINADCEIVNCRIRNGRNVVRAYGGNRDGNGYFVTSLGAALEEEDQIKVVIDGCILSQGREFILKMGANRALRATIANRQEPELRDQSGRAYPEDQKTNRYTGADPEDAWFYSHYVMTDLTLKDSVVETSGLFTVGIESNFSGEFLYEGATDHQWRNFTREWERSGGTSFATVLRLEGDVRLYDWKDISLIDSSTLIESPVGQLSAWLKLDIKSMLDFVSSKYPDEYGDIIETTSEKKQYVHGGIALYGGGRNYSTVLMDDLNEELSDFKYIHVNIGVLSEGSGTMQQQGSLLPRAAGTHDFNFYMYGAKDSRNTYAKQLSDAQKGIKYKGVLARSLFD